MELLAFSNPQESGQYYTEAVPDSSCTQSSSVSTTQYPQRENCNLQTDLFIIRYLRFIITLGWRSNVIVDRVIVTVHVHVQQLIRIL